MREESAGVYDALMASPVTKKKPKARTRKDVPWSVLVLDDPVNLMGYVTMVFKRVFGYSEEKAASLMLEVHTLGRSVVWTGGREKAEFYVQQLHGWQLKAMLEKVDE